MALTTISVKDASAATVTMAVKDTGSSVLAAAHHPVIGTTEVSETNPIPVRNPSGIQVLSATFTRPADTTAYAINEIVGVNTSVNAGNAPAMTSAVFANGEAFRAERFRLTKSSISLTNASFRIFLWTAQPTFTVGDNGAMGALTALATADVDKLIDYVDITMDRAGTAFATGVGAPSLGAAITIKPASGTSFYFSLSVLAAYTPANAETFTVFIEGLRP